MNLYLTVALLLVLALVQSTVMSRVTVLGVHPDLMLMAVTSWSLLRGTQEGMRWALVGGVALDLLSGARFGVSTLSLLIVSFLSSVGERNVFRFDLLVPLLAIPLATLLYNGAVLLLLRILGWPTEWGTGLTRVVLPATLVNTLGMPIVYLVMRALDRRVGREEINW